MNVLVLEPLEIGDLVATMNAVVWLLFPITFFISSYKKTDGIGGGKEFDNNNTMPEETIKAVLVCNGTKLSKLGFLSRSIVVVEKDKARYTGRFVQVIGVERNF